jgi:hypothetical protein
MNLTLSARLAVIGAVCVAGGAGTASILPRNLEGHQSSLRARFTMADKSMRTVTIEGVGCPTGMCSRVRAKEIRSDSIWLDGLASVREISSNTVGPVSATFRFKNGTERQASIIAVNRVLYINSWPGHTEKLDLGTVRRIDFE